MRPLTTDMTRRDLRPYFLWDEDVSIGELQRRGSLFATRPSLNDYIAKRRDLLEAADTLFAAVISGSLQVQIHHAYALKDAAKAHRDLESRATTGATPPPAPWSPSTSPAA